VGVHEAGVADEHLDPVAVERLVDQLEFALDDDPLAVHEVVDGNLVGDLAMDPFELVAFDGVHEDGALTQRLRRDRAPVDAGAAEDVLALDDRDLFARPRCLNRGALAAGPAPDHDHVEVPHPSLPQGPRRAPSAPRTPGGP